ncbi:hypothetical protein Mapa_010463 [Marchantia paleacea]|nr:hypothetical protein Mapa_010463 [Marchantia paleacea]
MQPNRLAGSLSILHGEINIMQTCYPQNRYPRISSPFDHPFHYALLLVAKSHLHCTGKKIGTTRRPPVA